MHPHEQKTRPFKPEPIQPAEPHQLPPLPVATPVQVMPASVQPDYKLTALASILHSIHVGCMTMGIIFGVLLFILMISMIVLMS
jgi:hypothetical protein